MMRGIRYQYYLQKGRLEKGLSLRFNFLMEVAGSMCFFALHLVVAQLVSKNFSFPGWSVSDYWILIGTFELFTYLSFFLYWRGINLTFRDITEGTFDFVLLSPINSRFKAFFRGGSHNNLISVVFSLGLLLYLAFYFHLSFSLLEVFLYFAFILCGLWFVHCLDVIFLSLNFKFGKIQETIGPEYNFQQAMKYPSSAFLRAPILLQVVVLPFSLLTTVPAVTVLSKERDYFFIPVYLGIVAVVSLFSEFLWNWGLKNYTSAS